ncbi:uncharacterized protein [Littorina saxatilis]|uniref:uncharacterized protein n=1 Tax=Littorina saxatilis TaxID=31220 RepID=UPI0038B4CE4D
MDTKIQQPENAEEKSKTAVCKLQVVSMQASYKRLYFPVGSCLVWALLLSLPNGILSGHHTQEFADNLNITGVTCTISDDFVGTKIPLVYNLVLFLAFLILVCIIGVSYGRILLYLWRHRNKLERWQVKVEANAKQPKKDVPEPEPDCRVSQTVPDSSAQPSPLRVSVTCNDVATIHNDVATIPNNVATIPNDVATIPNDMANQSATAFNEVATTQNEVATTTNKVAPKPNKVAPKPNKVAPKPNEVAPKPNKVAPKPNEVATKVKVKLRSKIKKGQTMMFAVLTLVFVVSSMPYLTVVILEVLRPELVEPALTTNGMMILLRSFYINSAVNPIVYSFCSPMFRFECRQFFARCPLVGSFLAIRD